MSGVFMDGGSSTFTDGGSSTFADGGSFDSTSYMNAGGGDGYLHMHSGEGINQAPIMDHANQFDHRVTGGFPGSNSGFLAHLLGLDQHQAQAPGANQNPNQGRPGFLGPAAQALKFTDLTHGLQISPGFGMLLVFLGFIGWLFVVYFIRHHEPMADTVLGNVPPAASVYADRNLMNQISHAMQLRISRDSGTVYEPLPNGQVSTVEAVKHPPQEQPHYAPSRFNGSSYSQFAGSAYRNLDANLGAAAPINSNAQQMSAFQPAPFASDSSLDGYNMAAMQTPTGTKLKVIANH